MDKRPLEDTDADTQVDGASDNDTMSELFGHIESLTDALSNAHMCPNFLAFINHLTANIGSDCDGADLSLKSGELTITVPLATGETAVVQVRNYSAEAYDTYKSRGY